MVENKKKIPMFILKKKNTLMVLKIEVWKVF